MRVFAGEARLQRGGREPERAPPSPALAPGSAAACAPERLGLPQQGRQGRPGSREAGRQAAPSALGPGGGGAAQHPAPRLPEGQQQVRAVRSFASGPSGEGAVFSALSGGQVPQGGWKISGSGWHPSGGTACACLQEGVERRGGPARGSGEALRGPRLGRRAPLAPRPAPRKGFRGGSPGGAQRRR